MPAFQRNAGGRLFKTAAELNRALTELNAGGGVNGVLLPLVGDDARFSDAFNSVDLRVSRPFAFRQVRIEPILEVFNVFNVTNILGVEREELLGLLERARARHPAIPRRPATCAPRSFGHAVHDRGRRVRVRRAAGLPVRRARDVLMAGRARSRAS